MPSTDVKSTAVQTVGNNITSEQQAQQLLSGIRFSGLTPLGTVSLGKVSLGVANGLDNERRSRVAPRYSRWDLLLLSSRAQSLDQKILQPLLVGPARQVERFPWYNNSAAPS